MSTQQKVADLNTLFGNLKGDINNPNIPALRKQALLILEEAIELVEATHPHEEIQIIRHVKPDEAVLSRDSIYLDDAVDAIGDLLTVTYGASHIIGLDGDEIYDKVDDSNRTKFLGNQDEANAALQIYFDKGIEPEALEVWGDYPLAYIRVVKDVTDAAGKFYPKGKFLKNLPKFKEPDFSSLLPVKE